jgi:tRNA (mo5U34)-methyltransferase
MNEPGADRRGDARRDDDIERLAPWFHNLHLPDGRQTAPDHILGDFPHYKWEELRPHLPADLTGATVLDVGCNAGFYSLELARRGARVTAIDIEPRYLAQARWAARQYGLHEHIEFRRMQVYDLARCDWKPFDLVLFLGVFYHLRHPLLGLDAVARLTGRQLFFQTLTMPGAAVCNDTAGHRLEDRNVFRRPGWPLLAFIEHDYAGDPTNWWAPNHAAVEAMLRSAGLDITARPGEETYLCVPDGRNGYMRGLVEAEMSAAAGAQPKADDSPGDSVHPPKP